MSGEAQAWRDMARDMFKSAGDVVITADILVPGGDKNYDRKSGKMTSQEQENPVPALETQQKSKLSDPSKWREGDLIFMVGTFDLSFRVRSGQKFRWTDPVDQTTRSLPIVQANYDDGGTNSLAYVHVSGGLG